MTTLKGTCSLAPVSLASHTRTCFVYSLCIYDIDDCTLILLVLLNSYISRYLTEAVDCICYGRITNL